MLGVTHASTGSKLGVLVSAEGGSIAGSDLNAEQSAGVARALAKEIEEEEVRRSPDDTAWFFACLDHLEAVLPQG